jgi:hypothetical protein
VEESKHFEENKDEGENKDDVFNGPELSYIDE